jgi:hypothetical protein
VVLSSKAAEEKLGSVANSKGASDERQTSANNRRSATSVSWSKAAVRNGSRINP